MKDNYKVKKFKNHMISHMISHMIDLTQLGQFHIIIYTKINPFLIMCYLTYLTFWINLHNKLFESTFVINLFNQFILNW